MSTTTAAQVAKYLGLLLAEAALPLVHNKTRKWVETQRKKAEKKSHIRLSLTFNKN